MQAVGSNYKGTPTLEGWCVPEQDIDIGQGRT